MNNFTYREKPLFEDEGKEDQLDPEINVVADRRLITQPYDLVIEGLLEQIEKNTLHLRPLSDRPSFQRRYVWSDKFASKFIESILLNIPIPPCYLSQNEDFELDVIDGQQRIYSLYRFINNQFKLLDLEVMTEHNGLRFFELPPRLQRKLQTYTLRCVIITNDSNQEIRFDVFERLNTNTVPLNAQELRNCIHRGALINLVNKLVEYTPWLKVINRKEPDKRMRDEELILRFFAFHIHGLNSYRTPQKHWLNEAAKAGRRLAQNDINELDLLWKSTIDKSLVIFSPSECFRRLPLDKPTVVINRALMDLTMLSLAEIPEVTVHQIKEEYRRRYIEVLNNTEFDDLITRAIDHKSRTLRRFAIWDEKVTKDLF